MLERNVKIKLYCCFLPLVAFYTGEGNGTPLQYSCLENPMDGGAWWAAVHGVARSRTRLGDCTFTCHFHALEKETATHSSVLAWRIPGTVEPGGLPSLGSHRVGHDWSDLAAAAAFYTQVLIFRIPWNQEENHLHEVLYNRNFSAVKILDCKIIHAKHTFLKTLNLEQSTELHKCRMKTAFQLHQK